MRIFKSLFCLALVVGDPSTVFAQQSCMTNTKGTAAMHSEELVLVNDAGQEIAVAALIADDRFERASGFQHICPEVIDTTLILFRYQMEIFGKFHMQNVWAPLDIAFFDQSGKLIQWMLMDTYSETSKPLYGPGKPFRYALEARPGFFVDHDLLSPKSYLKVSQ